MNIDLLSPSQFSAGHPFDQYGWLRANAPVYWHAEPGGPGFWAITRYQDIYNVDRNFHQFSSEPTVMIEDPPAERMMGLGGYKMMLMLDPPQHTAYRKLIRNEFTVPAAGDRVPRIQELARQIVNEVIEKGECDFVSNVAGEMPSYVIAELMGIPLDDGRELYKLTETIHTSPEALPENAARTAIFQMFEYGRGVIETKRKNPKNDLATKLLQAEVDGKRLNDLEFLLFFLLLIDAGGDTTRNLLSAGLIMLTNNPDQLAWLKSDLHHRLPSAREELLRYTTPVIYMRRTARHDIELVGQKVREGDKVVMYFGSANRDAAKFSEPDKLNLSRSPNEHIAFGTGPHSCLGQHIARIEIDAILREVLTRMNDVDFLANRSGCHLILYPGRNACLSNSDRQNA